MHYRRLVFITEVDLYLKNITIGECEVTEFKRFRLQYPKQPNGIKFFINVYKNLQYIRCYFEQYFDWIILEKRKDVVRKLLLSSQRFPCSKYIKRVSGKTQFAIYFLMSCQELILRFPCASHCAQIRARKIVLIRVYPTNVPHVIILMKAFWIVNYQMLIGSWIAMV